MDQDYNEAGTPKDEGAAAGSIKLVPGFGRLLIPAQTHEDYAANTYSLIASTLTLLEKTNERVLALQSEVAALRNEVEGLLRIMRTTSGVTPGNQLDTIATKVGRLHYQAFEAGAHF